MQSTIIGFSKAIRNLLKLPALAALCLFWVVALGARIVPDRYVVELTEPAVVERIAEEPRPDRRKILRENYPSVLTQQRIVARLLERAGATPIDSVGTVANAMLVQMPEERAAILARLPGVKRVYPVFEVEPELERAIPIHRVPEAWARIGGAEQSGAGIKIAIIDSGIDPNHPGFIDPSLPMPEGFPRANRPEDLVYTSNKVIVARVYDFLLGGISEGANDGDGHGSAVAMAAAGVVQATADGPISGVAPKAYLGNYKVLRATGSTRSDIILKAIDDAVRDGMTVINVSIGSPFVLRPEDDLMTRVLDRLAALGVAVVTSAGNHGPDPFSLSDLSVPPSVIAVGATWNDRVIGSEFQLSSGQSFFALPSDAGRPVFPISAPVTDVAALDSSGLACGSFPANSLAGRIAFILRGTCFFEDKLNNVTAAGATGAVVYTDADRPDPITMAVGPADLPAVMVSHSDGLQIKDTLAGAGDLQGTINFRSTQEVDPNRVADFSSRGPNSDLSIKPDIVAIGVALNTATLGGGYETTQGTSLSSPIVAGAMATLMGARPGHTIRQYKSLLVNAADPLLLSGGGPAPIQHTGGGVLNLDQSMATNTTAHPVSISFGDTTGDLNRRLTISNLSTASETYTVSTQPFDIGPPPSLSETSLTIPPGQARTLTAGLSPDGLSPGDYQGYIWIRGSRSGSDIHVPYWYAVPSGEPGYVNVITAEEAAGSGQTIREAFTIRVTDSSGIPLLSPEPEVTVESGGGSVISLSSLDNQSPGLYQVTVRMGSQPGNNVFRIRAGAITETVTIQGQ